MLVEIPRVPLARHKRIAWSAGQACTASSRNLSIDKKKKKRLAGKKDNMEPRKRGHDGSQVSPDAGEFVLFCAHIIRSLPENITTCMSH
jgi:hypothetical protein